jgi:hypothetical protein
MNNLSVFTGMSRVISLFLLTFFSFQLSSQNNVEVIGQVKITGGSPGVGKVLTSDNVGLATWEMPTGTPQHFGYIYNSGSQVVALGSDVIFSNNTTMTTGFTHVPGTSSIIILNTGIYKANFSVSGTEHNQFAMFLNGAVVPGSIYGSGAGTQQNIGQMIFSSTAGDILTFRNHTSAAAVTLASNIGGTDLSVNASLMIEKL